ncbi:MAG: DinB family protein [Gemmatimonadota bacterium]|nr:DinB family protein [Gemmatimonadota bacterium]
MVISEIDQFLDYFHGIRARTRRVVLSIPPDHIEWTHAPGKWTLGDLVRHLGGIERWMWAENAKRRPSRYPGHGRELAEGHGAVVAYLDAMHAESMDIFRTLTPEDLNAKCMTPGGAELVVWKWLRAMVEHEAHHRGQIHLMLSMLGAKTTPLFGLTEEEVHARSSNRDATDA